MALVGWKKEYETGIESVDEEHKELLALINETTAKLRADLHTVENIESYLGEIHAKISAHFALEERFMRDASYSHLKPHKDDHERLLDDLRRIMVNYRSGSYLQFEQSLIQHLNDWFMIHFTTHDSLLHGELGDHPH